MGHFRCGQVIVSDDTGGFVAGSRRAWAAYGAVRVVGGRDRSYSMEGFMNGEKARRMCSRNFPKDGSCWSTGSADAERAVF